MFRIILNIVYTNGICSSYIIYKVSGKKTLTICLTATTILCHFLWISYKCKRRTIKQTKLFSPNGFDNNERLIRPQNFCPIMNENVDLVCHFGRCIQHADEIFFPYKHPIIEVSCQNLISNQQHFELWISGHVGLNKICIDFSSRLVKYYFHFHFPSVNYSTLQFTFNFNRIKFKLIWMVSSIFPIKRHPFEAWARFH